MICSNSIIPDWLCLYLIFCMIHGHLERQGLFFMMLGILLIFLDLFSPNINT